jgi:hypothetical protein
MNHDEGRPLRLGITIKEWLQNVTTISHLRTSCAAIGIMLPFIE